MSISGGIKFLSKSYADIDYESATMGMTSGADSRNNMRDRRSYTFSRSIGSSDLITETWTATFDGSYSINRLLLAKHNFKDFNVKYWNGSTWVDFSGVVTQEGTQSTITETACNKQSSYYEFTPVTTSAIRLTLNKTQIANAEKFLFNLYVSSELGTFEGYPTHKPSFHIDQIEKHSIKGRDRFTLMDPDNQYLSSLTFQNYVSAADHALVLSLIDGRQEFLIYPCGGNASQFRYPMKGNRLEDIYLVWFRGDFSPAYLQGVYACALSYSLSLAELT